MFAVLIAVIFAKSFNRFLYYEVRRVFLGIARHIFLIIEISVIVRNFFNILKIAYNFCVIGCHFNCVKQNFTDIFIS